MTELYSPAGIAERRKKARNARRAALVLGVITLGAVIALCIGVRTANALWRQWAAIGAAVAGGTGVLLLLEARAVPEEREAAHEEGVLQEEPEILEGTLVSAGKPFRIPRNVAFLPVSIRTGTGTEQVRLNTCWQKILPEAGTALRVRTGRKYITALAPAGEEKLPSAEAGLRSGRGFRRTGQLLSHVFVLALACGVLVSWVFNQLTDTDRVHKVTLFAEVSAMEERALASALEEKLPSGIRMVTAHPFHYAMLDTSALETADLYLMTEAGIREHRAWLCTLPEEMRKGETAETDGEALGLLICRAGEESGLETYLPALRAENQDLYLCFGAGGYHLKDLEKGVDDAALTVAETLSELSKK